MYELVQLVKFLLVQHNLIELLVAELAELLMFALLVVIHRLQCGLLAGLVGVLVQQQQFQFYIIFKKPVRRSGDVLSSLRMVEANSWSRCIALYKS